MTREEIMNNYAIPKEVLDLYESLNHLHNYTYTNEDIEPLSMIITFREISMTDQEIQTCLASIKRHDKNSELCLLNKKRRQLLHELYTKQKQVDALDYLRSQLENNA